MMTYLECKVTCSVQYKNAKVYTYTRCNVLMTFLQRRTSVTNLTVWASLIVFRFYLPFVKK